MGKYRLTIIPTPVGFPVPVIQLRPLQFLSPYWCFQLVSKLVSPVLRLKFGGALLTRYKVTQAVHYLVRKGVTKLTFERQRHESVTETQFWGYNHLKQIETTVWVANQTKTHGRQSLSRHFTPTQYFHLVDFFPVTGKWASMFFQQVTLSCQTLWKKIPNPNVILT